MIIEEVIEDCLTAGIRMGVSPGSGCGHRSATATDSTAIGRLEVQWLCGALILFLVCLALAGRWTIPRKLLPPPELQGTAGFCLDLNQAPVEELALLPNVGFTLAQRIVDERTVGGPFRNVSDVMRTPGIGEERFRQMEPMLQVKR